MMLVRASQFFTDDERKRIAEAVKKAESTTSGEIVPVLATASGNYDRGLFLSAITGAVLATLLVVGVYLLPLPFLAHDPWAVPLYIVIPVQLLGLIVGYRAARCCDTIWKGFIPAKLLHSAVGAGALNAFADLNLSGTRDATGILIYVSLFERMVVVLADKAISSQLPPETWNALRDLLVSCLKENRAADGFVEAIARCGQILTPHFPIKPDDTNELANDLRIID